MISAWMAYCLGLAPLFLAGLAFCARGAPTRRLAGLQMLSSLGSLAAIAMTIAFDQASSLDLALALGLLGLPAAFLMALFMERWV